MKKMTLLVLLLALFSVNTTVNANVAATRTKLSIDIKSTFFVNAELRNDDYNQILCLYSDGSCVIRTEYSRGSGTYDINMGKIYITWENGTKQQGSVFFDDGQVRSVSIEGVSYSRKLVKKRS